MRIIAGRARGRTIDTPVGMDTRPTLDRVRESLFNILQPHVMDARVLDLFAGSGALALEAVSRGALSAVLVDHDKAAVTCEQRNIDKLGFSSQTTVLHTAWENALQTLKRQNLCFDMVFLDPPYVMQDLTAVTEALKPVLS